MARKALSARKSRRSFASGAKVHRKNVQRMPMRGGIRL